MDTSRWYNLNDYIKIVGTQRKFYRRYLHKLVYTVYGAWALSGSETIDALRGKLSRSRHQLDLRTIELVTPFFDLYTAKDSRLRFIAERSTLSVFCDDIDYLFELAQDKLSPHKPEILSTVLDQDSQELLDKGMILVKTPTEHCWRINIRSGFYRNLAERQGLAQYLKNLGDEVKVTKNILQRLGSNDKYLYGGYFHVKDPRVVDMIRLITPDLVQSVDQLVVH